MAFCSAFLAGITLLLAPLIFVAFAQGAIDPLAIYAVVFSKWGVAIVAGAAVLGFTVGGERMANFFAFLWGTHPFWSEVAGWYDEHETLGVFLLLVVLLAVAWLLY